MNRKTQIMSPSIGGDRDVGHHDPPGQRAHLGLKRLLGERRDEGMNWGRELNEGGGAIWP